ncbi:MAG: hypothetical protein HC917_01045 [Richelia sp. SM2_1_7]|nr:hypothetical protein [Richelia sp. SM2_1_7]
MIDELAGGIQLVTPSGILKNENKERNGFPMLASSITLKAQRDLGNISFKDINGTNVEIASGASLELTTAPTVSGNLKISSNGYFDDKGNFVGGQITTGKEKVVIDNVTTERDVVLKASGLELAALIGIDIKTDVRQLQATIVNKGDITIAEANSITLSDVSVKQGNLTISTVDTNAVMTIGKVEAGKQVSITTGQINSAASDGIVDLSGESLAIKVTRGIASSSRLLETSVKNVSVEAGTGVNLSNYGELTVDSINAGGGVRVETHSPLTIAGAINAGSTIRLQSGDSADAGDDLRIKANLNATQGNIILYSGDHITVAENVSIVTPGQIIIQGDFDNKDVGIGSTITLSGTLNSNGVTINSGDDRDTITINGSILNYGANSITTVIRTGKGDDMINLGDQNKTLNSIAGAININTSDDFDTLNIENSGNPLSNNLKVTINKISGLAGMTGDITYANVEKININLGSGDNLLDIASDITTDVNVNSGTGQNAILMDYSNKTRAFDLVLDNGEITGFTGAGNLKYTNFQAIQLNLGTGNDKFTIKDTSFTQKITVDAGGGNNQLIVDIGEETNSRNETVTINQNNITGLGLDQRFKYANMQQIDVQMGSGADNINLVNDYTGKLNFNTGLGNDTLTLEKTLGITQIGTQEGEDTVIIKTIAANTTVNTGAGNDTIIVGSDLNTVDNIAALLTISGGEDKDYLIVNDGDDTDNNTATLTSNSLRGLDMVAGINYSGLEIIDILMGSGDDLIDVESTHKGISYISTGAGKDIANIKTIAGETNVKLGADDDTINVGARNQKLDNIAATLIVSGGSGNDSLNVDDSGDNQDNTAILYDTLLTGLGMNGKIDYGSFENLDIKFGSGSDILSINSTHQQATTISMGIGSDKVIVESIAAATAIDLGENNDTIIAGNLNQVVDNISATLTVTGGTGSDAIIIDDSGDTQDNTAIVRATRVTGLGMNGEIDYQDFESLDVMLGSGSDILSIESTHQNLTYISTGAGSDTVNVETISGKTNVKFGTGDDNLNIGDINQLVAGISTTLIVSGGLGYDNLNIDDSGDNQDRTAIIYDTLITGLGMNGEIDYGSFENLNINLGSGSDIVSVADTHQQNTNINTGAGNDTVNVEKISGKTNIKLGIGDDMLNVGNINQQVDDIGAALIVSGGSGFDRLNVDDSGDNKDSTATIYDTLIVGLGMNGEIDYGSFEELNINLGSANDILSIAGTHQQTTNINTGIGSDTVNVESISGKTSIELGTDDDTVNVSDINQKLDYIYAPLVVSGGIGNDILNIDDSGDTQSNTAIIKSNLITGLGMNGEINYSNLEKVKIWLGSNQDIIAIESISVDTEIFTGLNQDSIIIDDFSLLSAQLIVDHQRKKASP